MRFVLLAFASLLLAACGRPARSPCAETGWGRVIKVSAGAEHTCGLTRSHALICWGHNAPYTIDPALDERVVLRPRHVMDDVADVAAGYVNTCVVRFDGRVVCWGANAANAYDDEPVLRASAGPREVEGLGDATSIACGGLTCCATRTDGRVACFGDNRFGQLGDGTRTSRLDARDVLGMSDAVEVAVGGVHACARRRNGEVWCWGSAQDQRLADGSVIDRPRPGRVPGIVGATSLAAGPQFTCVIAAGDLVCWGIRPSGFDDERDPIKPTSMGFLAGFDPVQVSMGFRQHSPVCVRSRGGDVACLGDNLSGQLGIGHKDQTRGLQRVDGLEDVEMLAVGGEHVCALRADGELWCWGANTRGQLGDQTTDTSTRPKRASFRAHTLQPDPACTP